MWWNSPYPMWGMGWIFPLIGLAFIIVCLFAISRFFGTGVSFCGSRRHNETEDLRREMRELRDEIAEFRKKELEEV
ncbi:MAG: hypothetical protein A2156_03975 [Deltaproteobacteria bacterium RBG_16_48_10]|nr:MAG: hypothetical protein A2156_03975 [Deltaproteobacteria bacterium RBG_16_48_10]